MQNTALQISQEASNSSFGIINSGFRKSHYQPMTAHTREWIGRDFSDFDNLWGAFALCRANILGLKLKTCSLFHKQFLLKMAHLVVHFPKEVSYVIPCSILGEENAFQSWKFLHDLEKMGLICACTEYYQYCNKKDHSVATSYGFSEVFRKFCKECYKLYDKLVCYDTQYATLADSSLDTTAQHSPSYIQKLGWSNSKRGGLRGYGLEQHYKKQLKQLGCHTRKQIEQQLVPSISLNCDLKGSIGIEWSDIDIQKAIEIKYNLQGLREQHLATDIVSTRILVTVHRNKHREVTRIGLRPTNYICQTYNENHEDKAIAQKQIVRKQEIVKLLGEYHHLDVHCSIFNVNYAMTNGKFINADFYQNVANTMGKNRNEVKPLFMKANFGMFASQIDQDRRKDCEICLEEKDENGKKTGRTIHTGISYKELQSAMKFNGLTLQGKTTEVFLWEDWLYTLAQKYMLDDGIRCVRVYDSFYTDKAITEEQLIAYIQRALPTVIDIANQIHA